MFPFRFQTSAEPFQTNAQPADPYGISPRRTQVPPANCGFVTLCRQPLQGDSIGCLRHFPVYFLERAPTASKSEERLPKSPRPVKWNHAGRHLSRHSLYRSGSLGYHWQINPPNASGIGRCRNNRAKTGWRRPEHRDGAHPPWPTTRSTCRHRARCRRCRTARTVPKHRTPDGLCSYP